MSTPAPPDSDAVVNPINESAAGTVPDISLWRRFCTTPMFDVLRGRLSGRLDVRSLVAAGGLPEAAQDRILETVKRTRLWRIEKVGVAAELSAHFDDGLEAGTSLGDLLAGFGDARTTATLIRRAKLRCRAWPWRVRRRVGQAFVGLVVLYIGLIGYYAMGRPNLAVDYVAEINKPSLSVPEADRAWPVYRGALLAMDRERFKEVLALDGLEPEGESWDQAVTLVEDVQPQLETIRHAASMRRLGYIHSTRFHEEDRELWPDKFVREPSAPSDSLWDNCMISVLLPYLNEYRQIARLLAIDAAYAAQLDDGDRVVADLSAILDMTAQVQQEVTVVDQLVGLACLTTVVDTTSDILRDHPDVLTDDHVRRLAHGFASERVLPMINLEFERMMFYDLLQRVYTDDGHGDGRLVPGSLAKLYPLDAIYRQREPWIDERGATVLMPLAGAAIASRREMARQYERVMDGYATVHARPLWETLETRSSGEKWMVTTSDWQRMKYSLVLGLAPGVGQLHRLHQDAVGRRDGILVALALQMHRRRHGGWPETLDELVPDLLPSMPRDRFTGSMLGYRVLGDEAVIYSVGDDLNDDGGVLPSLPRVTKDVDKSPRDRFRRLNKSASPRSYSPPQKPDGDWILWHTAAWQVERE